MRPEWASLAVGGAVGLVVAIIASLLLGLNIWLLLAVYALGWYAYSAYRLRQLAIQPSLHRPRTFEEAVARAHKMFLNGDDAAREALELPMDHFTADVHHSAGRWMRNNWGLWSQDSNLYHEMTRSTGLTHADDLSGLILIGVWHLHRNTDPSSDIYAAIKKFQEHWEQFA